MRVVVGGEYWWEDPDEAKSSGFYKVTHINSDDGDIDHDTVISLRNSEGSEVECTVDELSKNRREFFCAWGRGYGCYDKADCGEGYWMDWFSESRGYDREMFLAIYGLDVGEAWNAPGMPWEKHSVVRIQ